MADGAEAGKAPAIGDLVIVPYPEARERYGCPARAGLLLEDRRSSVKVFFAEVDRTLWLERRKIETVTPQDVAPDPLVARLHRVARLVEAEHIEIHERRGAGGVFHLFIPGADLDRLLAVRELAGPGLSALRVEPAGMRHARLVLVLEAGG